MTIHGLALTDHFSEYNFCALGIADLTDILAIEEAVYSHPWTRGNFLDSFYGKHEASGIRTLDGELIAYFVLMPVLDELQLLTFAVDKKRQNQGYARIMLERMLGYAKEKQFTSILLEVRVSNLRAIAVYQCFGFIEIGRRKAYYPAANLTREDAIVMRLAVE
ncbi:MAG: ribosomal protein S18-alanine N-acetyltransferase [Undibacterium sp.]|nr:ribosomal protein S18-alanine N-acetyltransferase [Undibacterium sp.]